MSISFTPAGRSAVIVRVASYNDKCMKGTISGTGMEKPISFASLAQLILIMDEQMDKENLPQRGSQPRTFQMQESQLANTRQAENSNAMATFQISVLFRQNSSWQGTLTWTDQKMDAQFRSVLDLIRLMDSALSQTVE